MISWLTSWLWCVCVCVPRLWLTQLGVDVLEVDMGERGPVVSNIRVLENVTGDSHVVRHKAKHSTAQYSTGPHSAAQPRIRSWR